MKNIRIIDTIPSIWPNKHLIKRHGNYRRIQNLRNLLCTQKLIENHKECLFGPDSLFERRDTVFVYFTFNELLDIKSRQLVCGSSKVSGIFNSKAGACYWVNSSSQFVQRSLPCSWIYRIKYKFITRRFYQWFDLSTKLSALLLALRNSDPLSCKCTSLTFIQTITILAILIHTILT